jgi:hypothetical protein
MNIVTTLEQYNEDHVYFLEPIKNNIINNGNFIRIIYSTALFTLNGIYIAINIKCNTIDRYYNKYICGFDVMQHRELIDKIRTIEITLMRKITIPGKTPQYKIYEQLKNGNIKVFSDTFDKKSNLFLLKIAGIWESDYEYGLTYKFLMY